MTKEHKEILIKLDKIVEGNNKQLVKTAKIEEHLKNLNGSVKRHETNINELYSKTNENRLSIGKIVAIWGALTVVLGAVGSFLFSIISKIGGK